MKDKTIVILGDGVGTSQYISKLLKDMGDNIIIIDDVEEKIIYPNTLSTDDVIHLGNEIVSTERLLKMAKDLREKSDVDTFIRKMTKDIEIPELGMVVDNSFMLDGGSKFIPSAGGTNRKNKSNKKGRR